MTQNNARIPTQGRNRRHPFGAVEEESDSDFEGSEVDGSEPESSSSGGEDDQQGMQTNEPQRSSASPN